MNTDKKVWELAREKAEEVLEMFKTPDKNVDLYDICEHYNISVETKPLLDNVSGYIKKGDPYAPPIIVVNGLEKPSRQRFTLAHELGHFFEREYANDSEYVFIEYRGFAYNLHEFYADEFAGALLMPEDEIRKLSEQNKSVRYIANHFEVSDNAVRKRLERLAYSDSLLETNA